MLGAFAAWRGWWPGNADRDVGGAAAAHDRRDELAAAASDRASESNESSDTTDLGHRIDLRRPS
jgi:hypothetical protein